MDGDGELLVPGAQEFLETLGVEPAASPHDGDEPAVFVVFEVGADERLTFSYDVAGRSVRLRWSRTGRLVLDLFREGATTVTIDAGATHASLRITLDVGVLRGRLHAQVHPFVMVEEHLLLA